ncbi:MAG: hypothetical protein D6701_07485 [Gemmatimonadetes bacterium]|nr:MAG: hypothetical protein D6701_07485 [Gemmatimonadota bacterium]
MGITARLRVGGVVSVVAGLALLATAASARAQIVPFPPFDEGPADASFVAFRDSLHFALSVNDTAWIFAHTAEDVMNGFGGAGGVEELREVYWDYVRPDMLAALGQGGFFTDSGGRGSDAEAAFTAPYTWRYPDPPSDWAGDPDEWLFETGAITVDGTPVVDVPGGDVLTTLGHVVVRVVDWLSPVNPEGLEDPLWVQIELADGRIGNVSESNISTGLDYRFFFEKRDGRWWFTGWAAGD